MDAARRDQIDAILGTARALNLNQREQFLDEACAYDLALRRDVEQQLNKQSPQPVVCDLNSAPLRDDPAVVLNLIESIAVEAVTISPNSQNTRGFQLSKPERNPIATDAPFAPFEKQIGPYQVRAWLGLGCFGNVYRATHDPESQDDLIIELLEGGADKNTILSRFEDKRYVHAALGKHPNIAALLDVGVVQDHHIYLLKNSIEGQPIDQFCDDRRLKVPGRLKLFIQVCTAIHFAHQHSVIHGNLTRGNIVVTADAVPKVLDLGVRELVEAEASNDNWPAASFLTLTRASEPALRPEYASPEQLKGEPITTASDVYALGIVLYRLLIGCWPYQPTSQETSDVLQAICEQIPEKPSTAAGARLDDKIQLPVDAQALPSPTLTDVASARSVSPWRLKRMLKGDLDSIVLMALQKEPERRYPSAAHLAEDLTRYLQGVPVHARRHFPDYRSARFIQRHRIAAAGLFSLLLLFAGSIVLTRGLLTAKQERDRNEISLRHAHHTLDQLLARISDERLLNQPATHPLRQALLRDAQGFYEDYLNRRLGNPQLQAEQAAAQTCIAKIACLTGSIPKSIAEYDQAIALWEKLLSKDPENLEYQAKLAQTLNELGLILLPTKDRLDEALNTFLRAQEINERLIAMQPDRPSFHLQLGLSVFSIAEIRARQGKLDEAMSLIDHVLKIDSRLAEDHPELLEPRIALATAYATLGRLWSQEPGESPTAITCYERAIELRAAVTRQHPQLIDQSYELAVELSKLSGLQQDLGQTEPALQSLRWALQVFERVAALCPEDRLYQEGWGMTCSAMSDMERKHGDKTEALALAKQARTLFERLVAEDPGNEPYRRGLAQSYNDLGRVQILGVEIQAGLRSFQHAVDLFESLHQLDAQDNYKLACNIALCIPLIIRKNTAQGTVQDLTKGDRLRCQLYGDRAIESLRRSFQGGFLNSQILHDDTDLDGIRTRADFKALVKEIEETPTTNLK